MAYWRVRDPGSFPVFFHEAMRAGIGTNKLVWFGLTHNTARQLQRDFQLFRFCLRQFPAHSTAHWERELIHRTKVAYSRRHNRWELLLTSRPAGLQDLVEMR